MAKLLHKLPGLVYCGVPQGAQFCVGPYSYAPELRGLFPPAEPRMLLLNGSFRLSHFDAVHFVWRRP